MELSKDVLGKPVSAGVVWRRAKAQWYLYVMLIPAFSLLLLFTYYPAANALVMSLFDWNPPTWTRWVGLDNFVRILKDPVFWKSWRNLLIFAAWAFTIPFVMPIVMAELIFNLKSDTAKNIYRVAILIPVLVPGMVTLMLWKWIYTFPDGGANLLLRAVGLGHLARPWMGNVQTALPALLVMGFPWITGTAPLIYLAGLLNISQDVIDASLIDGCSIWRRILSIDLPHIMGQIRLFLIFGIIGILQGFGKQLVITSGGPSNATMVPGLYLYRLAFGLTRFEKQYTKLGEACAVGTMLFILIFVVTFIVHKRARVSGTEVTLE